jgi:hypothetical protein
MYPFKKSLFSELSKIVLAIRTSSKTFEENLSEFLKLLFIIFKTVDFLILGIFEKSVNKKLLVL